MGTTVNNEMCGNVFDATRTNGEATKTAQDTDGWYVPSSKMGETCASANCAFSLTAGNGDDATTCLDEKPKCDKMYGGDASQACIFSETAGKDKYLLTFIADAATTKCKKGTCTTGPVHAADQKQCCKPNPTKCNAIFSGTAATQCEGITGTAFAADLNKLYVPLAAAGAANYNALVALGDTILNAARNRCCKNGNDVSTADPDL